MTGSSGRRLSIGEFGRLTWLSPKALRLYERRGLLAPQHVDRYTGYRFYVPAQADRARTIALLRRVGMPLDRIGAILDAAEEDRDEVIAAYRDATIREHERTISLLDDLLSARHPVADRLPVTSSRTVAEQSYLSRRVRTTAADLPSQIERLAAALTERAGGPGHAPHLVVVYHGEVGWESDGPIEVRVPVDDPLLADGSEPAGREFYVDVPFGEVQFPTILRSFDAVRHAAAEGDHVAEGAPREIYLDGDPFRCQVAQRYVTAVARA